jgi:hypothetical protein
MESAIDNKLKLMGVSLRQHIDLAKELNLNFVAKLLSMAAIEIDMNLHKISQQELDALCACVEGRSDSFCRKP